MQCRYCPIEKSPRLVLQRVNWRALDTRAHFCNSPSWVYFKIHAETSMCIKQRSAYFIDKPTLSLWINYNIYTSYTTIRFRFDLIFTRCNACKNCVTRASPSLRADIYFRHCDRSNNDALFSAAMRFRKVCGSNFLRLSSCS